MSKRKTNKMPTWKKVITVVALLAVGALIAVGGIHLHKHWDDVKTSVENVFNNKTAETPTEAVEQ